jgi:transposase
LSRALLRRHGYVVPTGGAEAFARRVMTLGVPGRLLSEGGPLLALMRTVNAQLAYCEGEIEHISERDPRVRRLRTAPSLGPVTAAAFVATLDKAARFRRAHQVEAYLGLVPGEWSTGEGQRRGRITKTGNTRMRWLLIQAALSIMRLRDPRAVGLRTWALRIAARRGRTVAAVALARRRAGILWAMLRDEASYEPQRWTAAASSTPISLPA